MKSFHLVLELYVQYFQNSLIIYNWENFGQVDKFQLWVSKACSLSNFEQFIAFITVWRSLFTSAFTTYMYRGFRPLDSPYSGLKM